WILDYLAKFKFIKYEPAVCILPLGTGNDLSRTLNWGQGYVGDVDIEDIVQEIDRAKFIKLDRWEVKIDKNELKNKINSKDTQIKYMNNYISIGCDALVTLNFHRERFPIQIDGEPFLVMFEICLNRQVTMLKNV
ncbi:unnamed protein product, partial [Brachionus calyciflorus]